MPRALSPLEAARILAQFDKQKTGAVISGMTRGLNYAKKLSVTRYMQGLGSGASARPPNPAPGPLGIRSGNLRRTVRVIAPEKTSGGWTGGLAAGGDSAPQARIQEEGGTTRAHVILPKNKKALMWKVGVQGPVRSKSAKVQARGASNSIFARRVNHPGSRIPARPYLAPAMADAKDTIVREVENAQQQLIDRLFGK